MLTPATSIRKMLVRLGDYCRSYGSKQGFVRPDVSVWVAGREMRGLVIKIASDDDVEMLLLGQGEPLGTLTMIPTQHISVLTLHNPRALATIVSFGAIARPLDEAPLASLGFEKQLKAAAERMAKDSGAAVALTCDAGVPFHAVVAANGVDVAHALAGAFASVAAMGDMGKSALAAITGIDIVNSQQAAALVVKNGARLTVSCNLAVALDLCFEEQLRSSLESVL